MNFFRGSFEKPIALCRFAFILSIVVIAAIGWIAGSHGSLRGVALIAGGLDLALFGLWTVKHASELAELSARKMDRIGASIGEDRLLRTARDRGWMVLGLGGAVTVLGLVLMISPSTFRR